MATRTPPAPAHLVWDWNGTLLHDIDVVVEATNVPVDRRYSSTLTFASG